MAMREFLFRGKLKANGEWAYGCLKIYPDKNTAIITPDDTPLGKYGIVDQDTVGQYTGKDDRYGTKVFEYDIIQIFGSATSPDRIGVVMWCNHDQCYVVVEAINPVNENAHLMDFGNLGRPEYFEVIGNIYDNPKWLKGVGSDA